MNKRNVFFATLCSFSISGISGINLEPEHLLKKLTLDQKIGQLFMVACVTDTDINKSFMTSAPYRMEPDYIKYLIDQYHIGGVIFLGRSSKNKQQILTQQLQKQSTIPLLIGQDFESGLMGTRLIDHITLPHAMTLGALPEINNDLIYQLGYLIGLEAKALGVHINFAPVVDLNSNPDNPVINDRSFGYDPNIVGHKGKLFAQGLAEAGIIACAKHFPGHGDTSIDSHESLPVLKHNYFQCMHELEPFVYLIKNNIPTMMMGHLKIPILDPTNKPASCSHTIINFLRNELKFNGAIFTDGLGMGALTSLYKTPGEIEKEALLAGNDCLLCPLDVPAAVMHIKQAMHDGNISEQDINEHVLRILKLKSWVMQQKKYTIDEQELMQKTTHIKQQIYYHAITLVKNENHIIPISSEKKVIVASIHKNTYQTSQFMQACKHYFNALTFEINIESENCKKTIQEIEQSIDDETQLIIALESMERSCKNNYGITALMQEYINQISVCSHNTIVILFGNPYAMRLLPSSTNGLIIAFDHEMETQQAAADLLNGSITACGILPVKISQGPAQYALSQSYA